MLLVQLINVSNFLKKKSKGKRPFQALTTIGREEYGIRPRLDSQSNPESLDEPSEPAEPGFYFILFFK